MSTDQQFTIPKKARKSRDHDVLDSSLIIESESVGVRTNRKLLPTKANRAASGNKSKSEFEGLLKILSHFIARDDTGKHVNNGYNCC